ncbi:1-deoxy-D-xylulose-5-phosphate reductoisomerase [Chromatiales bacterium (ex Bugula neritina AB1)]|nr:1-deoxy-D-xylulose-5-phosphate reductoisomerase [Chromatiales bacterium (ex Bugula neritina AB1)]
MADVESVAIFGSTGSIGTSTLDVIERNSERYRIEALCANKNVALLYEQCCKFEPGRAAMADAEAAAELARRLLASGCKTKVLQGSAAQEEIASSHDVDIVMAAIVGFAGLKSTLIAAQCGKRILLANKESMVVAGDILIAAARDGGATIVPVDSEHNAIFQCLPCALAREVGITESINSNPADTGVQSLVLTASGGPFREWSMEQMAEATVAEALNHPNWSMGSKISIDSATMMNKGLEVIEACYLFGVKESSVEVVVHPQSVIHSMVRYRDGSVLAQLGRADMKTPIAQALAWPGRIDAGVEPLDFRQLQSLAFEIPDENRFPCLALAREAMRAGKSATGVLNAANEVAVQKFIDGVIGFTDIARVNRHVLHSYKSEAPQSIDDLYTMDQAVRRYAVDHIDDSIIPGLR